MAKKQKVIFAPQDRVDADPEGIAALLVLLGHPEALVTDESQIGDFLDESLVISLSGGAEFVLERRCRLVDGIAALRSLEPTWPQPAKIS